MKAKLLIIILLIAIQSLFSQKEYGRTPLPFMNAPDSIYYKLACFLAGKDKLQNDKDSIYLAITIQNLENVKDYKFKQGLFSYKYNSPHSSRQIFIYLDNGFYIFKSNDFEGIIQEYVSFVKNSKLELPQKIKYLKLICKFLSDEYYLNKE